MTIPARDRYFEYAAKVTSGALSLTTSLGEVFRLSSVRIKFNTAPTTSENVSVAVDSKQADADYDTVLLAEDPSVDSVTDILWVPDTEEDAVYTLGNEIKVDYPNTDNRTVTALVTLEKVE